MFDVAHRGINGECCSHLQVCEFVSMSHVNFRVFFVLHECHATFLSHACLSDFLLAWLACNLCN